MNSSRFARACAPVLFIFASDAFAQSPALESGPPAPPGSAGPSGVAFGADQVKLDARTQSLDVSGNVRVDEPPFHLRSEGLRLTRVAIGVELEGKGRVAFCPCLGTPLAVRFSGATVAPPYDLILKDPVVEVFGVPLAWAPALWLRAPGRPGLLPPDLAWRGDDGFFAGGGIHVPWLPGEAERGVDLRAGGYVKGGVEVQATLTTTTTSSRLGWDRLRGDDGVSIEARGAAAPDRRDAANGSGSESAAWQISALRGARAVRAATGVDEAARPFDHGQAEVLWRPSGWTLASRVESSALRGGRVSDLGETGPVLMVRRSDALGRAGAYDATLEAGQLAGPSGGATSFARTEAKAGWATRLGALGASLSLHGLGDLAQDVHGRAADGAAQARLALGVPLVRGFGSPDAGDPWVHTTEPRLEAAALATRAADPVVLPAGRGMAAPSGGGWVAAAGWANAVGRWGSRAAGEFDITAGAVGGARDADVAVRARVSASGASTSLRADFARVAGRMDRAGGAFVAQARIGTRTGVHLKVHVAERDGVDPVIARVLLDPTLEPASGFLAATGWTGGIRAGVPFGARVTVRGGADVDFDARLLVAAVGAIELHDPCNCVVVRANGSERIGRSGVDLWLSVDLPLSAH